MDKETILREWIATGSPPAAIPNVLPWPVVDFPLGEQRYLEFVPIGRSLQTLEQEMWGRSPKIAVSFYSLLWDLWLPLALQLRAGGRGNIQGMLGLQGTGKTTLTSILARIFNHWGWYLVILSLDDFYHDFTTRQDLQKNDPRLIWRGPPGTHDVALAIATLRALKQQQSGVMIPIFDKSLHHGQGDRIGFKTLAQPADFILFEGWCVGFRPLPDSYFSTVLPPIQTEADRQFARDCNRALMNYLPLWDVLANLWVLQPQDYRWSYLWRQEAERVMIAEGKAGLSPQDVEAFVDYFWQALHPQLFMPQVLGDRGTCLVISFDFQRYPQRIWQPSM